MLPGKRSFPSALVVAMASLLASTSLSGSSQSFFAFAARDTKTESRINSSTTSIGTDNESERHLFELASPFDSFNDECASVCSYLKEQKDESGEGSHINACPKYHDRYSPCNFCCYQGASSLKLRFFGCSGNTSIVFGEDSNDNGYNSSTSANTTSNVLDSGIQFIDCNCFNKATNVSSASFGDIASCSLFDHEILEHASPDVVVSHFDICLVSTTDRGDGPVANFSQSLPDVIGLKHVQSGNATVGTAGAITFFETTCDEKTVGSLENFAYPLFPGYGKFVDTCPYNGYIDFNQDNSRIPDEILFLGQPPSTLSFYRFIDGTSVGFWPKNSSDDSLLFHPTFAECHCGDCNDRRINLPSDSPFSSPTSDPSSSSDGTPKNPYFRTYYPSANISRIPSQHPSAEPTIEGSNSPSTMHPSTSPSSGPTTAPSLSPSESPSEFPSETYNPSIYPSNLPSKSPVPSFTPSNNPSEHPSEHPISSPVSEVPSSNPSGFPPSSAPNQSHFRVTPSPFHAFSTNQPTSSPLVFPSDRPTYSKEIPIEDLVSTEFPTDFTILINPTESPTDEDCVADETKCFIFAVQNCVDKDIPMICVPHLNEGSRRFLEEQIRFHEEAVLAELSLLAAAAGGLEKTTIKAPA